MRHLACLGLAVALTAFPASSAYALGSCSITSVTGVAFGTYNVFNTLPVDSAGSVSINCTLALSVVVNLGRGGSSSFFPRTLSAGGSHLDYNLYLDAARISVWGDGTGGTSHYGPLVIPIGTTTLNVYGRLPARQTVPIGSYSDTIVVTVIY